MPPLRYLRAKTIAKNFLNFTLFTLRYVSPSKNNLTLLSHFLKSWMRSTALNLSHLCTYLHWNSFNPTKRKINIVATPVHRISFICSRSRLQAKLYKIRSILVANGYLIHIIASTFTKKIRQFNQSSQPQHEPKKCPIYLHLSLIENVSTRFETQITTAIERCYFVVETRVVFTTRLLLHETKKDVLPANYYHNKVIYQFVCHCDIR